MWFGLRQVMLVYAAAWPPVFVALMVYYRLSDTKDGSIAAEGFVVWCGCVIVLFVDNMVAVTRARRRAERRQREAWLRYKNRCAACDYDLRGVRSDHCPECGELIPSRDLRPSD